MTQGAIPTVVVHIDRHGTPTFHQTIGVNLVVVDERTPFDRSYQITTTTSIDDLDAIIGDELIGYYGDDRHAAIEARILAAAEGKRYLRSVE